VTAGSDADGAVYQPAEDSELLRAAVVDGVSAEECVLEVGTGSGYVAVSLAADAGATVVASDLNPHACRQTRERAATRGTDVSVVRADLVAPFRPDRFDAVVFNPPYLPDAIPPDAETAPVPEGEDWMSVALSGGESGRAVVEPFLDAVGRVLAPDGTVYLLASSLSDIEAVLDRAAANGFEAETVSEDSFPFETLAVLRLRRS
jgi:release factor glutamine methyltransferase